MNKNETELLFFHDRQPMDLLTQFDSSQMSFNPSIVPPPKDIKYKSAIGNHNFKLKDIEDLCNQKRKFDSESGHGLLFDFHTDMKTQ